MENMRMLVVDVSCLSIIYLFVIIVVVVLILFNRQRIAIALKCLCVCVFFAFTSLHVACRGSDLFLSQFVYCFWGLLCVCCLSIVLVGFLFEMFLLPHSAYSR